MAVRVLALVLVMSAAAAGAVSAAPAATVNGVAIPYEEYVSVLETMPVENKAAGSLALERLISQYLLVQLAEKEGVPVTNEQLDARMQAAQKEANLADVLKSRSMTAEEFKRELRTQQAFVNLATKGIQVTDGEIEDYYFKNKDKYKQPARVKIGVIIAKDKSKIEVAQARLKSGADFAAVARGLSEDEISKSSGGALGWVWPNQPGVPPVVVNIAFELRVGTTSKPIKVQDQWVIIKALDRKSATSTPIEEVKESIREAIAVQRGASDPGFQKKLRDFQRAAAIEIGIERFKDLAATLKERIAPDK